MGTFSITATSADTEHGHLLWELSPSLSVSLLPRQFSRCWTQGNNWGPVPSEYQVNLLTKLGCPASSMAMVMYAESDSSSSTPP